MLSKRSRLLWRNSWLSYSHVVPFLFRNTGLAPEHHVYVIDMFKDAGIICLSSLKFEGEDKDETGMDKFIARRPIVIYRLSSQRPPIAKYWPEKCPEGQEQQVEVHIELVSVRLVSLLLSLQKFTLRATAVMHG